MNLRYLFPLLTLFFWLSVNAGNPIFNAGFELTDAGYKCVRYLRPDRNPELKFIRPELSSSSHSGSGCSLKIPNPFAEAVEFSSEEFKLKPNQKYCFYPMHFEPEIALQLYARPIQNQIEIIRTILF